MLSGNLILRTPADDLDYLGSMAGAFDQNAQQWLNWHQEGPPQSTRDWFFGITDANRSHMHGHLDGSSGQRYLDELDYEHFVAFSKTDGRYAGGLRVRGHSLEGWLAPHFRGRGLGADLFAGAAALAHDHLDISEIHATVPLGHTACQAAVRSAGFEHTVAELFEHRTGVTKRC